MMSAVLRRGVPATCIPLLAYQSSRAQSEASDEAKYYGGYGARGIGTRWGIDPSEAVHIDGTALTRTTLISETHERLRSWATDVNWREATRVHKAAYFTRMTNLAQEDVLQRIRAHYTSVSYVAAAPVQAALFHCEDRSFAALCTHTSAAELVPPTLVEGVFDEKREACIVDFANKRLGGAYLSYGMVQEEKLFAERPDLGTLCARALLEMPDPTPPTSATGRAAAAPAHRTQQPLASPFSTHPNEAWILRGAPAFAGISWYGRTPADALSRLRLEDPADDPRPPTIVAIDAIKASFEVYERRHLELMVRKAYVGFAAARHDPIVGGHAIVATGHWGCGAFYNNERVMFVVQALAAALAGVSLRYHVPPPELAKGSVDLAPAVVFIEEVRAKRLSVDSVLDLLAKRSASDTGWQTKWRPPSRSRRWMPGNL